MNSYIEARKKLSLGRGEKSLAHSIKLDRLEKPRLWIQSGSQTEPIALA